MLSLRRARGAAARHWDPDDVPWLVGGLAALAVVLVVLGLMVDYSALDAWTALIVFLVLVGVSVPAFQWVARKEGDPWLFKVMLSALVVQFAVSMARFYMIFVMYDGEGDAGVYHGAGAAFAANFRDGDPLHPIELMNGFPVETQRIGDVVGVIYTITGPSIYAAFLIFAFVCFWGRVLMLRAFMAAVPEGDHRRFALLVLFLPSVMFWPSSIGKEALMIGCLGIIVYGGGLLLAPRPKLRGALFFVGGTLLVMLIRPHVAIMSLAALGLAVAVGVLAGTRTPAATVAGAEPAEPVKGGRGRAVRLMALAVLVVLAGVVSTRVGEVFNDDGEGGSQAALEKAQTLSSTGGSQFDPISITGPSQVLPGLASVYLRPFPWEARSMSTLIAAAESLVLAGLLVLGWRRLLSFPRMALRRPFLVFCAAYVVLFGIGFSYFANFGILTRQRVQALPILLVALALPKVPRYSFSRRRSSEVEVEAPTDNVEAPIRSSALLVRGRNHG
jgi:hypothetical protein